MNAEGAAARPTAPSMPTRNGSPRASAISTGRLTRETHAEVVDVDEGVRHAHRQRRALFRAPGEHAFDEVVAILEMRMSTSMPAFLEAEDWDKRLGEEGASVDELKACLRTVQGERWTMSKKERNATDRDKGYPAADCARKASANVRCLAPKPDLRLASTPT